MKPILLSEAFGFSKTINMVAHALDPQHFRLVDNPNEILDESFRVGMANRYREILNFCEVYDLPVSKASCDEILELLKKPETSKGTWLHVPTTELGKRLEAELQSKKCFLLASERAKYCAPTPLFGENVSNAFPSAIAEIEDAGKCLAFERATACVFHLMRTMEACLKVLARAVGIPYAPSWESYLNQIKKIVETPYADKTPDQRLEHPFYSEAQAHLSSVKFAWRNPTMHIVRRYTAEEAEEVFNSVRIFMRHLATKLKE